MDTKAVIAAIQTSTDWRTQHEESLFWKTVDVETLLKQLVTAQLRTNELLEQLITQPPPTVSVYQADMPVIQQAKVIQLDGVKPIDAAIRWLTENDPDLNLSARQAAIQSQMSQATINRAQQRIRSVSS